MRVLVQQACEHLMQHVERYADGEAATITARPAERIRRVVELLEGPDIVGEDQARLTVRRVRGLDLGKRAHDRVSARLDGRVARVSCQISPKMSPNRTSITAQVNSKELP